MIDHYQKLLHNHWRGIIGLMILAAFVVSVQGCATTGYENVDTTRKALVVATTEIRAANLLLQDLIRRDAISDNAARDALGSLRTAQTSLQIGFDALILSGDPVTANTALQRANVALSVTITLLSAFAGEPNP